MKTIITYIIFSSVLLFYTVSVKAQTVNEGIISIMPGDIFSSKSNFDNKSNADLINDGELILYNDFNNDGLTTFTSGVTTGMTSLIGTEGEQKITGSMPVEWYNVKFKNNTIQPAFYLSNTVNVFNEANFEYGIIDVITNNGDFVFNENSSHNSTSNSSFVHGKVTKKGNAMFEFPIGHNYYRPSFQGNLETNGAYIASYFNENSNILHSHESREEGIVAINENEYWIVSKESGDEKIVLSLSLDSNTTPSAFFDENPETELAIVRWDDISNQWVNELGVLSDPITGGDYTKIVTTQVTGYGLFTLAIVRKNTEVVIDDLIIYNGVSPNGDGLNDTFLIKGINKYSDNSVEIYNRWGVKVYETKSYNEHDKMFRGYSNGRVVINRGDALPTGTYFYILKYNDGEKIIQKTGYLYLNMM